MKKHGGWAFISDPSKTIRISCNNPTDILKYTYIFTFSSVYTSSTLVSVGSAQLFVYLLTILIRILCIRCGGPTKLFSVSIQLSNAGHRKAPLACIIKEDTCVAAWKAAVTRRQPRQALLRHV